MKIQRASLFLVPALALAPMASPRPDGTVQVCGSAVPNSTGVASVICSTGSTVVSENDLTLICTELPPNVFGLFITGDDVNFIPNPGGAAGHLCVGGNLGRFVSSLTSTGAAGEATFAADLNAFPSPSGPVAVQPGDSRFFQFWHRDSGATGPTSNFSPGWEVSFAPLVPNFQDYVWPMLLQSNIGADACAICHGPLAPGGLNLGFTATMAYNALVNVQSTSPSCGGQTYVVPGDPGASLLYQKLTAPACGAQMPLNGTFAGDTAVIRDWILGGAPF